MLKQSKEKAPSKVEQHRKEWVESILDLMKQGKMFWQRPWDIADIAPVNALTKRFYNGCNVAYLLTQGMRKGYDDPRWLTYNQAQEKGWQVRKGEKGTRIEFWSKFRKDGNGEEASSEDEESERMILFCKLYTVFNAAQVEGIPALEKPEPRIKEFESHERSERIMENCGVPIMYGGGAAFYVPLEDKIYLPVRERFHDEAHFYATALHEIAHSTGHKSRLNRNLGGGKRSAEYAREELRAEMASAFMQMDLGFSLTPEGMKAHQEQHAAYLQSWIGHLKEDYKELYRAMQDSIKIADYVLAYAPGGKKREEEPEGESYSSGAAVMGARGRQTGRVPGRSSL